MNSFLVALDRGEEINWDRARKYSSTKFEYVVEQFADSLDNEWLGYHTEFEVQVKCEETGVIKRFEINVNIEFDVLEILE